LTDRCAAVEWIVRQGAATRRLDRSVIEHFRAGGPGWQSRINAVLAEQVKAAGR